MVQNNWELWVRHRRRVGARRRQKSKLWCSSVKVCTVCTELCDIVSVRESVLVRATHLLVIDDDWWWLVMIDVNCLRERRVLASVSCIGTSLKNTFWQYTTVYHSKLQDLELNSSWYCYWYSCLVLSWLKAEEVQGCVVCLMEKFRGLFTHRTNHDCMLVEEERGREREEGSRKGGRGEGRRGG